MTDKTFDPAEHVDQVAHLLELPITPEYRPGVTENFARITAIAHLFLEFPLPDEIEVAPVFQPDPHAEQQ